MLLPEEIAALRNVDERVWLRWSMVAVVALLLTAIPALIYLPGEGRVDHVLGRDEPVMAEVDSVRVDGSCGRQSRKEYRVEVTWTADGTTGRGSYPRCGSAPQEGTTVQVWVGPSGHVEDNSPTHDRLGLIFVSLGSGVMGLLCGVIIVLLPQVRRRRLLAAANAGLASGVPVELWRGAKSRLRMRPTAPTPELGARAVTVEATLYQQHGHQPTTRAPRAVGGPWWLHLAPITDSRRRIGLLRRGWERCWIELPARRR